MGVFDCLIDKGREPKVGMEYIYNFNMAWPYYEGGEGGNISEDGISIYSKEEFDSIKGKPYSINIKNGLIVEDVVAIKAEDGYHLGYDFTIKDFGVRCHCNYAWAFWENTLENMVKIEEYRKGKAKLDEQEKFVEKLRKDIEQLTIK